ncbi:hypothetical protein JGH11_07640 [Dysgonomonas sp. Marseille-P4677]|nr:hypothetical protein [Dysgonomonas sp. Marseille-P4677]
MTLFGINLYAQNVQTKDSTKVVQSEQKADRNVMLNASSNTGPRDVNIGLPASVGGTTVQENGLPVVFFFWPEFPTAAWRSDAMLNKFQLLDLNQTALNVGDLGFSVSTYDNLGTDKFQGKGTVNSNHFGLIRNSINISGPITKNGLKFSAGMYTSLDPGSFKPEGVDRYYGDKTQMYKFALSQDYTTSWIKGTTSVLYKYINAKNISNKNSPFIYKTNGEVEELDNFRSGRDSYYENTGKVDLINASTGKHYTRDIVNDYGSRSNTIDLISNNTLSNGLNANLILRYREAKAGIFAPFTMGIDQANSRDASKVRYQYEDGTPYTGNAQGIFVLASKRTPIKTFMSRFEVGRKSGNHDWKIGIQESYYGVDKFTTETTQYYQEVAANPNKLIRYNYNDEKGIWAQEGASNTPGSGNYNDNISLEYHNGHENKHAIYLIDKWNIIPQLEVTAGARFEYHAVRGDYLDRSIKDPATNLPYTTINAPKLRIDDDWFKKAFTLNIVYKMTNRFGLLGEASYNEQGGQLESYSSGKDPKLKKSKIPGAGFGVYYNHPLISLVSKATYIKRDQYRSTVNFMNPNNPSQIERPMTHYDIETIGWTTDVILKPFSGFDLHLLFTYQAPKYKNYSGTVSFADGTVSNYNFSDKNVTAISKVLIEIDPSYTYKDLRVWGSARYFSKQYMNKPNTLHFAPRWETFAGVSYKLSKSVDVSCTFVNLLNQKGASGSISDADLILTKEDAAKKDNTIMSGSYIRPFTVEFGLNYRF